MVRNNYDLTPEIRCRGCGWYWLEQEWCGFWEQRHNPNGFCDEGVGKCCRNCGNSRVTDINTMSDINDLHLCEKKNEIVDAMGVCEDWKAWFRDDGNDV